MTAAAAVLAPASRLVAQASPNGSGLRPIRLGGPAFADTADPEALALAPIANWAIVPPIAPTCRSDDTDRIRAYARAFARHDVVIAEVGRWCNLLDADAEKRRRNLETVTDGLALAEAIGARCCVDIAGSFSPTSGSARTRTTSRPGIL